MSDINTSDIPLGQRKGGKKK